MQLKPLKGLDLLVAGNFCFHGTFKGEQDIIDSYRIEIKIPNKFPKALPIVRETGSKIPNDGNHHLNSDGTLCLGSPLRLLQQLQSNPTILGFAEKCLVPFLYAMSNKLQNGKGFIFDELAHGKQGIADDYSAIFGIDNRDQAVHTLKLLGMKKRIANKKLCPCGCGNRLGVCKFRFKLKSYRKMAPRSWFAGHSREIETGQ